MEDGSADQGVGYMSKAGTQKKDLALVYILKSIYATCKASACQLRCPAEAWKTLKEIFRLYQKQVLSPSFVNCRQLCSAKKKNLSSFLTIYWNWLVSFRAQGTRFQPWNRSVPYYEDLLKYLRALQKQ